MQMITQVLFALTIVAGCFCQRISVSEGRVNTPCTLGAREGRDRFTCIALIHGHQLNVDAGPYNRMIKIAILLQNKKMDGRCGLFYNKTSCWGLPYGCITCEFSKSEIKMSVSLHLKESFSHGKVYMYWDFKKGAKIYSDKNYTLTEIRKVKYLNLSLTVDGPTNPKAGTSCEFTQYMHTNNVFQLCCFGPFKPCYTQISVDGVVVASDEAPCVTYVPTSDGNVELKLSGSFCTTTEYLRGDMCLFQTGKFTTKSTTTTTTTTRSTVRTTKRLHTSTSTTVETTTSAEEETTTTVTDYETTAIAEETTEEDVPNGSPEVEKTDAFEILIWIALTVAMLVITLSFLAYWIISSNRKGTAAPATTRRTSQVKETPPTRKKSDNEESQESLGSEETSDETETQV